MGIDHRELGTSVTLSRPRWRLIQKASGVSASGKRHARAMTAGASLPWRGGGVGAEVSVRSSRPSRSRTWSLSADTVAHRDSTAGLRRPPNACSSSPRTCIADSDEPPIARKRSSRPIVSAGTPSTRAQMSVMSVSTSRRGLVEGVEESTASAQARATSSCREAKVPAAICSRSLPRWILPLVVRGKSAVAMG